MKERAGGVIRRAGANARGQMQSLAAPLNEPDAPAWTATLAATPEPAAPPTAAECLAIMETCAGRLRTLILSQPARKLIGFIWAHWTLGAPGETGANAAPEGDTEGAASLLLAYVHAVLSAHDEDPNAHFNELACADIISYADEMYAAARQYCDALAADPNAKPIEPVAKAAFMFRTHRPDVLDSEFLAFVLQSHDEALRLRHGIGAADIVKRLVALPEVQRSVRERAANAIEAQMNAVAMLATERAVSTEDAAAIWNDEEREQAKAAVRGYTELLDGGLCNLSAHTDLPITLLRDLSYEQGSETHFFAEGATAGTPLRTFPARVKPLLKLKGDFFAPDPAFGRADAHRPLLAPLAADDRAGFEARQNMSSQNAFARALSEQLKGARIDTGVCFRDPESHEWTDCDLVIRMDDVLIVVDAKAAATLAPPPADFEAHAANVMRTVGGAYDRCRRFIDYLGGSGEVPIFRRNGGRTMESGRVRLRDYSLVLPIGLSVESLAPLSGMVTALPSIKPILGRYAFMAMSVDDLMLLRRVLPTREEFLDYMRFRQGASHGGATQHHFEADYLADYAAAVAAEIAVEPEPEIAAEESAPVAEVAPAIEPVPEPVVEAAPEPDRPREIASLLAALKSAGEAGWQRASEAIRAREGEAAVTLANALSEAAATLATQENRWLHDAHEPQLFVWLQRTGTRADLAMLRQKAKATAVTSGVPSIIAVLAHASTPGEFSRAVSVGIVVPTKDSSEYRKLRAESAEARAREELAKLRQPKAEAAAPPPRKMGRNEPCFCGSGKKFKRCHGK
jgi:hypothetical protein